MYGDTVVSLATDIIAKAGLNLAPPTSRKGNRSFLEPTEDRNAGKPKHARKYHHKWAAIVWRNNHRYHLGMHDTGERAEIASRLFLHWTKEYDADDIPRKPTTELPFAQVKPAMVSSELLESVLAGHTTLGSGQLHSVIRELLSLRK